MANKPSFFLSSKTSANSGALTIGTSISLALHAVVLAVSFTLPERVPTRAPSLDVILVNARHATAPKNAQALAQANLDGGGNSDEDIRATSPLPPQEGARDGNDLVDMSRGLQAATRPQQVENVLTQKDSPAVISRRESTPDNAAAPQPVSGEDATDATAMALKLEAEIAARTQAYNQRPRRKAIGARAEEYRFAQYIEDWRTKTERVAEVNYPAAARGKYGDLVMTVSIKKDGTVEKVKINRPSKYPALNEAAERIVYRAAPYAPFPPDIARDLDVLDITRTWTFTNGRLNTR
jgi:protein TonB